MAQPVIGRARIWIHADFICHINSITHRHSGFVCVCVSHTFFICLKTYHYLLCSGPSMHAWSQWKAPHPSITPDRNLGITSDPLPHFHSSPMQPITKPCTLSLLNSSQNGCMSQGPRAILDTKGLNLREFHEGIIYVSVRKLAIPYRRRWSTRD